MKAEKPKHIQELMNEALEPLRNAKGLRMKPDSGKNVKSLSEKGLLTPKGLMEKIENNFGSFTDMSPLGKNEWVFHGIGSIYVDDWLCLKEDFLRIESALAASEQRIKELEGKICDGCETSDRKKLAQSLDWYKTCLERSQKREKDLQRQIAASEAKALQERNSKEYFMGQMNIHKKECAEKGQSEGAIDSRRTA